MKIEVKKIDELKREINIEVSGDIVRNKFEDVFKKINQEVKVSGFRPGHIPRDILEKNFSGDANQMVLKELVPDLYSRAIENEKLDVVNILEIFDVKLDRKNLSFKAAVDVTPEINIKNYKGIKLVYKKTEVTLDDIKRGIDSLKESRKVEIIDDNFAKGLGCPNLPALERFIEGQMFIQRENQKRKDFEEAVIEGVLKGLDFKIPQSMVNRQLDELLRQAKLDMALKWISTEKIEEEIKSLPQELLPHAKKQVRVFLVLSEIARKENIPLDDHMPQKVIELLLKEADWVEEKQ